MVSTQNDDLTKQIIEMKKKHEEEKIEKLLEGILINDTENIDILFRLACLELYIPFADYYACYIYLEKIISISQKHAIIASSCLTYIEQGYPCGDAIKPDYLYPILRQSLLWFFEVKKTWLTDDAIRQIIEGGKVNNPEIIRLNLEKKLHQKPNDIETLLLLSLVELLCSDTNREKSADFLKKILTICKETEAIALVFLTYIRDLSYIDEALMKRVDNLHTDNAEINSMLKYAVSLFYDQNTQFKNPILEEKYLKESIDFYQGHVWNYLNLARLYRDQDKKTESKLLAQKAMANVKKIYRSNDGSRDYDPTSINELLGQLVKGIYFPESNLQWIHELE